MQLNECYLLKQEAGQIWSLGYSLLTTILVHLPDYLSFLVSVFNRRATAVLLKWKPQHMMCLLKTAPTPYFTHNKSKILNIAHIVFKQYVPSISVPVIQPHWFFCWSLKLPHIWGYLSFLFPLFRELDRTHITGELNLHLPLVLGQMSCFQWRLTPLRNYNCHPPNMLHSLSLLNFYFSIEIFTTTSWCAKKFNFLICLPLLIIYSLRILGYTWR